MAYLIVFASIISFTAYVWLIARDPTTRVASYAYVNPLIALLLGSFLAHERPTPIQYIGAALVVAGVASTIAGKRVTRREPVEKVA
jgi:drug/metabolite transporter (DMT)-like permease